MKPSERILSEFYANISGELQDMIAIPIDTAKKLIEHDLLIKLILQSLDEKFPEDKEEK